MAGLGGPGGGTLHSPQLTACRERGHPFPRASRVPARDVCYLSNSKRRSKTKGETRRRPEASPARPRGGLTSARPAVGSCHINGGGQVQGGSLSGEPSGGLSCHPCRGRHCPGRAPGSPPPQAMSTGGWRSLVALPLLPTAPSFHAQTQFLELAMPSPASACQAHLPSLHPLTYEVPAQTSLPPGSPLRPPAALLAHPSTSRPHSILASRLCTPSSCELPGTPVPQCPAW